jgi:hypothetical protein
MMSKNTHGPSSFKVHVDRSIERIGNMMNKTHGPNACKVHRVVPVYLVKLACLESIPTFSL